MKTFDDNEIKKKWPGFPSKDIQEWLNLDPARKVFYHFIKGPHVRVVYIMKKKWNGPFVNKVVIKTWPTIPLKEIEEFLELQPGELVDYLGAGATHISCVVMGSDSRVAIETIKSSVNQLKHKKLDN